MSNITSLCRFFALLLILAVPLLAHSEQVTLGDAKQAGRKLSKEDLQAVLPGSTYTQQAEKVYSSWTNGPDGVLEGSRVRPKARLKHSAPRSGKWWVRDDGAYCVDAIGKTPDDHVRWCREVYQVADGYVGFPRRAKEEQVAWKFNLER